jgi:hypothetical protein
MRAVEDDWRGKHRIHVGEAMPKGKYFRDDELLRSAGIISFLLLADGRGVGVTF